MTPDMLGLPLAEFYAGFIDIVLVKGTAVVLAALATVIMLRRSSASMRHAVWAAAFVALLALPVLRSVAPPEMTLVGVRGPSIEATAIEGSSGHSFVSGLGSLSAMAASVPVARPSSPTPETAATVSIPRPYRWIVGVWLLGLAVHLARFGAHLLALRRLKLGAQRSSPAVHRRVGALAAELGLRRVPATIVSPDMPVPGTFGLLRPTVVLPTDAAGWPSDQFDAAVLHELAHLRRGDYAMHLVAAFVRAVYWVNPMVLYAGLRLELERERACDDGVVLDRIDPIRYAEHLMRLAWRGREAGVPMTLSFANRSSLPGRVRSLLDRTQTRVRIRGRTSLAIAAITALALVPILTIEIFGLVPSSSQAAGLSDPDPITRRHAAWALGESERAAGVESLLERLTDPEPSVRAVAAWALGEIKDARAVESLRLALTDDDAVVREMAVLAIGEIADPSGLPVLREAGGSVVSDEVRSWAIDEILTGGNARPVFAGQLSLLSPPTTDVPGFVRQLGDPDPRLRAQAAESLGLLGASEAVDDLLDALTDRDPAVRAVVVWALDEINPSETKQPLR